MGSDSVAMGFGCRVTQVTTVLAGWTDTRMIKFNEFRRQGIGRNQVVIQHGGTKMPLECTLAPMWRPSSNLPQLEGTYECLYRI